MMNLLRVFLPPIIIEVLSSPVQKTTKAFNQIKNTPLFVTSVLEKVFKNRNISHLACKFQISNPKNKLKWTIDQLKLSDRYLTVISNLWDVCLALAQLTIVQILNRSVESVFAVTFAAWKGERT